MNNEFQHTLNQAENYYQAGNFIEAEQEYISTLKLKPDLIRAKSQLGLLNLWGNNFGEAESYLESVLESRIANDDSPEEAVEIAKQLARCYLRQSLVEKASEVLDKSIKEIGEQSTEHLTHLHAQCALFNNETYFSIEGPHRSTIPFLTRDPLPIVDGSVNGSDAVQFLIDTGGSELILDTAFASTIGAQIVGRSQGKFAGDKTADIGVGKVNSVAIGDFVVHDVPISTMDHSPVSQKVFLGRPIAGILGTGFLMHFLSTLDYQNQYLRLHRKPDHPRSVRETLELDSGAYQFPMWLVNSHMILAKGSLNDLSPTLMFIDTGLGGGAFLTSQSIYRNASVPMDWKAAYTGIGGGGEVQAIGVQLENLALGSGSTGLNKQNLIGIALKQEMDIFFGSLGFDLGGLISHQFFLDHAVSFDFQNMHLIVH